jgi:hypothetical protein
MECGTSPGRNTDIGVASDEDLLVLMTVAEVLVRVVDEVGEVLTRYAARPGFGEVVLNW